MKYLDLQGIQNAFAAHLIKYRGYSEDEAEMAVSDFPDRYSLPYLYEDFISEETIDGEDYEKNASYTLLQMCGIFDVPMFRFYTYYLTKDLPNGTVGEYQKAHRLFQVDDLNEEDFPEDVM